VFAAAHWWRSGLALNRCANSVAGDALQFMVSGSAPFPRGCSSASMAWVGICAEAYGISEDIVPSHEHATDYRFGSVGLPLPQNELRIAETGNSYCTARAYSEVTS